MLMPEILRVQTKETNIHFGATRSAAIFITGGLAFSEAVRFANSIINYDPIVMNESFFKTAISASVCKLLIDTAPRELRGQKVEPGMETL